jgi:hypothetical protein
VLTNGLLADARRLLPINGIYVSRHSDVLAFAASRSEALYARGLYGAYLALFARNVPVRFVHADVLAQVLAEGLRTLYVPVALSISSDEEQALAHFVEEGGTLVAEACTGLFDEHGLLQSSLLLDQVIDVKQRAVDRVDRIDLVWKAGEPESVSRRFVEPAVCQRRHGKGLGIFVWWGAQNARSKNLSRPAVKGFESETSFTLQLRGIPFRVAFISEWSPRIRFSYDSGQNMGLGTKNRQKQTADICKEHLREKYRDQVGLVEEFISELEGALENRDLTCWERFTDIKDIKEEMLKRLDARFEKWLNP